MADDNEDLLVRPNCCEQVQSDLHLVVFLHTDSTYFYDESEDREPLPPMPRWCVFGKARSKVHTHIWGSGHSCIKVEHCPFCGEKLPELVPASPPGPIMTVNDGGYYCATCKESEILWVDISYAFKLSIDELKSMGIYPKLIPEEV